ncbi:MAG: hypothetical protein V4702_00785 [Patescibacteria group bacterium]
MAKDNNYVGVLLEDIESKLKGIAEAVADLNKKAIQADQRLNKIEENTNLIPAVQAAIKDQTKQLNTQGLRIADLETAR